MTTLSEVPQAPPLVEKNVNETVNENQNGSDSDSESEYEVCKVNTNNKKYVISLNSIPSFFVNSSTEARDKMWELAREYATDYMNTDRTAYIEHKYDDELSVVATPLFLPVVYSRTICRLSYHKVFELQ